MSMGLQKVTLIGGEPLMSDLFGSTIELLARTPDVTVDIETNGLLLSRHTRGLQGLRDRLTVGVSIDGPSLRGEAHPAAVESVRLCQQEGLSVYAQTIASIANHGAELEAVIAEVATLGVPQRIFVGQNRMGKGCAAGYYPWNLFEELYGFVKSHDYSHVRFELPGRIKGEAPHSCGWNTVRCEIMPDGNVTPCGPTTFNDPSFNGGNVLSESLITLWTQSPFFKELRALRQESFEGLCQHCPDWGKGCFGSCRAWARSWGGSWLSEYPRCREFMLSDARPMADGMYPKTTYTLEETR
jgi:radical SAM protein with 4Fe4S-binding SPASM domain